MTLKNQHKSPVRVRRIVAMILALAICTGAMYLTRRCSHTAEQPFASKMPAHSLGDTIDVAVEISPLSYSLVGDTVSGLDYDMLRDIARAHNRGIKFHPFAPMSYAMAGVRNGNFDIVVASLAYTDTLKKRLLLTEAVYLDHEVLLQRTDDTLSIKSAEDLGGDTVWVADGSPFAARLRNLAEEIGDSIFVKSIPGHTAEHLGILVAKGRIPRAVVNAGTAQALCLRFDNLDGNTPVSFTQLQVWGVAPRRSGLRDTLNAWLAEYKKTPLYAKRLEQYAQHPTTGK